jgi:hypothetical protein
MPLGMEYFPSTGVKAWESITECIEMADFCIFVLAGKYGSIDVETSLSWTHKEYMEARRIGKPSIVLLRSNLDELSVRNSETDPERIRLLEAFHDEVRLQGYVPWSSETDLVTGLFSSIDALKRDSSISGWIRRGMVKKPIIVDEAGYNRIYKRIDVHHRYDLSTGDSDYLDMTMFSKRVIRGNAPEGLASLPLNWTKASDAHSGFDPNDPPRVELESAPRSGPGRVDLSEPRKSSGSAFTVDLKFNPPLQMGEEVVISITGRFPRFKFAKAELSRAASRNTPIGERGFEFSSWFVEYPTDELHLRVDIPVDIGMDALGPRSGFQRRFPPVSGPDQSLNERYATAVEAVGSKTYTVMRLHVDEPRQQCRYRLAWSLP